MTDAHILIVDDDVALLQALPQAVSLRLPAVHVDTSDSALRALELITSTNYDAIVSDIKMPGMDGLALLAKIQEICPDTPTLLITGHGDHNLAIHALRGGAYDFIQKPIDRDYFVAALQRAIQTHQLRNQVKAQQHALELHAQSLEKTVQERTRELVEANAAKDEFISMASHELKTPLASLKGMTQLLHRRLVRVNSPEVPSLVSMENSIRRMEVLVNDLLNISSVDTGIFTLHYQHCNINDLVQRLVDEYVFGTNPRPVVQLSLPPGDPVEADVDIDRLGQVIINLLSNARKYSEQNTPIRVFIKSFEREFHIIVSDSGVGIPPAVLPQIFERFYRVPGIEVQTGSSIGFGLGLYISKLIIERHQGRIEVESKPGEGSIFTVVLPLAMPMVDNEEMTHLRPSSSQSPG